MPISIRRSAPHPAMPDLMVGEFQVPDTKRSAFADAKSGPLVRIRDLNGVMLQGWAYATLKELRADLEQDGRAAALLAALEHSESSTPAGGGGDTGVRSPNPPTHGPDAVPLDALPPAGSPGTIGTVPMTPMPSADRIAQMIAEHRTDRPSPASLAAVGVPEPTGVEPVEVTPVARAELVLEEVQPPERNVTPEPDLAAIVQQAVAAALTAEREASKVEHVLDVRPATAVRVDPGAPFVDDVPQPLIPTADGLRDRYLGVIRHAIEHHPRSLQKVIGPSEVGNPCDHCLVASIWGVPKADGDGWLATVGTGVHAWLDEAFSTGPDRHRWLTEHRTVAGTIAGRELAGTSDLFDLWTGTVIDHKVVGATTLRKVMTGDLPAEYVVQRQVYGLGFERLGLVVRHVAIAFLPRNAPLEHLHWDVAPYDREMALAAIDRAERLYQASVPYAVDQDALLAYIATLPRAAGCRSCGKYPDAPLPAGLDQSDPFGAS